MSSFAISMMPFIFATNVMPTPYLVSTGSRRSLFDLGFLGNTCETFNKLSYMRRYYNINNYSMSYSSAWNNMYLNICGLVNSFGSRIYGNAGITPSYQTGEFGTVVRPNTDSNNGNGNNTDYADALKAANERAEKAEKEAAATKKENAELKQKVEKKQGSTGGN